MKTRNIISDIGTGALPVVFSKDRRILLVDQRCLPHSETFFDATDFDDMCLAISDMVVRGAPSIGVAAALGLAMKSSVLAFQAKNALEFMFLLSEAKVKIQNTRPTAVNLKWETDRVYELADKLVKQGDLTLSVVAEKLIELSKKTISDHIEINKTLSEFGKVLIKPNASVLTHCNAGSLATGGWGTALGVIRSAYIDGANPSVFVDETRPRNQGARLTMWELTRDKIPCTLICDSMAGHLMKAGKIDLVITGADRIALNGDAANKIGTYSLAVLANHHQIPFYIAAPLSTFDRHLKSGDDIPIEHRSESEITLIEGRPNTVAEGRALNPAFDVTPAALIASIVCEKGVLRRPFEKSIAAALANA
ncbi:MAG: S-methyl-5-thioribose-1-phosphate isomerase [Candidatus Obscuribacterales bacterium]|nr:S-methyl-5-thioribose-1-phosphate isomerase [Candidatus Obscuribacterales bacterium]